MNKINTAIIPAAGFGTRMLPVTKVISKEMLPVGNKPIIDYVVDDLVAAGIERIVIVVQPGDNQIRDYYSSETKLEDFLQKRSAIEKYEPVVGLEDKAEFVFVEQSMDNGRYGTTIPLLVALEKIGDDQPVLIVNGDALPWQAGVASQFGLFIDKWQDSRAEGGLIGMPVPKSEVSKYGVLEIDDNHNFIQIVEKPPVAEAPSNFINLGCYIFPAGVTDIAANTEIDANSGEYYITDVLNQLVDRGVYVHTLSDTVEFLDVGTPKSFARSNQIVNQSDLY